MLHSKILFPVNVFTVLLVLSSFEGKPELDNPSNILLIPFPIQETTVAIQTDNVTPRAQTLLSETDRCEVEELAGKDETDSQEDVAHVQLNEDVKIMIVSRKRFVFPMCALVYFML